MPEDDYKLLKLKGSGAFGKVYKARRKDNKNQICALKYVSKGKTDKEVQDAKNEIFLLKKLRHPNIIQLLDSFETPDHIVLVCEYAVKELFKAIKDQWWGGFTEEKARTISCQICSALFYLHANKVLHRDLKPQNILVTKDQTIKLCDFGFSRFMGETYYARSIVGTPLYMSPELLNYKHVYYTQETDLWALGCIIYEMCVGKPAFECKSLQDLCKKQGNVPLPQKLSDDLKSLLLRLLTYDPHQRINWPNILKHRWFNGGIEVSEYDLSLESPYTRPEIAAKKRQEHRETMKVRLLFKRMATKNPLTEGQKKEDEKAVDAPDGVWEGGERGVEAAAVHTTDGGLINMASDADDFDLDDKDRAESTDDEEQIDTVVIIIYDDEDCEIGTQT